MSSITLTVINDDFSVCPQINPEDLLDIKNRGYKTVINNRPDGESANQPLNAELEKTAKEVGINYIFHPIVSSSITPEQVAKMSDILANAKNPVFAFCRSGGRSNMIYTMAKSK